MSWNRLGTIFLSGLKHMLYYWWVLLAIALYGLYAYFSVQSNINPDNWKFVGIVWLCQCLGFWPLLARHSNNILLDGIIYDSIVLFVFYIVIIASGAGSSFTPWQWLGTGMVIIGSGLIKFCD